MKTVPLTKGYEARIDDADFNRVRFISWRASVDKNGRVYARGRSCGLDVMMHRLLMDVEDPAVFVDHRDGDGLNNQRHNLRLSSNAQNIRNQRPHADKASSRFKGVYQRPSGKFRAQIMHAGRKIAIGTFGDEMAAARAYDAKARELHGDFARLNFPERAA